MDWSAIFWGYDYGYCSVRDELWAGTFQRAMTQSIQTGKEEPIVICCNNFDRLSHLWQQKDHILRGTKQEAKDTLLQTWRILNISKSTTGIEARDNLVDMNHHLYLLVNCKGNNDYWQDKAVIVRIRNNILLNREIWYVLNPNQCESKETRQGCRFDDNLRSFLHYTDTGHPLDLKQVIRYKKSCGVILSSTHQHRISTNEDDHNSPGRVR